MRFYWEIQCAGEQADGSLDIENGEYEDGSEMADAIRAKLIEWGYTDADITDISVYDDAVDTDFVKFEDQSFEVVAEDILSFNGWRNQRDD